jgi:hypothetical protein
MKTFTLEIENAAAEAEVRSRLAEIPGVAIVHEDSEKPEYRWDELPADLRAALEVSLEQTRKGEVKPFSQVRQEFEARWAARGV